MPYAERACKACGKTFQPPNSGGRKARGTLHLDFCPNPCRLAAQAALDSVEPGTETPVKHRFASPIKQIVFDLETFSLTRDWGVLLVGCFLIHGLPGGPVMRTFQARDYPKWKDGIRSNDQAIGRDIHKLFREYGGGAIAYAHNGERFDMRWLRTIALRYRIDTTKVKLVDPCQLAWKKYSFSRNSLDSIADFLKLKHRKMHLDKDVWRTALMDNDNKAWDLLVKRCQSDVLVLNELAGRVTNDVGMIDYNGSWR